MTHSPTRLAAGIVLCTLAALAPAHALRINATEPVVTGPRGVSPYVLKGSAERSALAPSPDDPSWSLLAHSRPASGRTDTLHIIAFMVEFNGGRADSLDATTGTGLFNIWEQGSGTVADVREYTYYTKPSGDSTVYRYDNLSHYQRYFSDHLEFAKRYYDKVSNGRLALRYDVFPREEGTAYNVAKPMTYYSPGGKRKSETWDAYYFRKTKGLMQFVVEAIRSAHAEQGASGSPFDLVHLDSKGNPVDSNGNPVGFLVLHAGASYLTDGGTSGAYGADSPSDMIDAFISPDFFSYYRSEIALDSTDSASQRYGVRVRTADGDMLVNELMMCAETSNQDGLNWGINGILVNQIARQLGIPDLFSTSSGISGVGSFCIMDYAGYSAARGFIPPWPSAWVRAFMGWDTPKVAPMGAAGRYHVKAPTAPGRLPSDTTILLVPINDHEYYLIENRQRNPLGREGVFLTDTTEDDEVHLAPYPYNVKIPASVTDSTGTTSERGNVILDVYNYDIGIPASGVIVWHVDEDVIRKRLSSNLVNADSLYRGISIVEADGVQDLGVMFSDAFYNAVFDWGGAEDLFPHRRTSSASDRAVDSMGPYTRPSTRSNDGGQTYLSLRVPRSAQARTETYAVRDYLVTNFADTVFAIDLSWNYLAPGWPRRMAPDSVFEPLTAELIAAESGLETVVLSRKGRLTVLPARPDSLNRYNTRRATFPIITLRGDTLKDSSGALLPDTAYYAAQVDSPLAMPSLIAGYVMIPVASAKILALRSVGAGGSLMWDSVSIGHRPSTWVGGLGGDRWAVGTADGLVVFGHGLTVDGDVRLATDAPVNAIAVVPGSASSVAAVQADGRLSLASVVSAQRPASVMVREGIAPYTVVCGDLDNNDSGQSEIVVCDSRHGLWTFDFDLRAARGWSLSPNDWAAAYATTEKGTPEKREEFPVNLAAPSLADINGDGCLDILVGGTNGVYAVNYKGVLVKGWPYYLDNRYWLQRGSVTTSPVVARDKSGKPTVLFSSPTGDNVTFAIVKVSAVSRDSTKVYFRRDDGSTDSIWGLAPSLVDSIVRFNDGLVAPYVLPGGYIDAVNASAQRPLKSITSLANTGKEALYDWPLTIGATIGVSPVVCDLDADDTTDLIAVSASGWIYRWELPPSILMRDSVQWRMTGYGPAREFAFLGMAGANTGGADTIGFYSFPNPARNVNDVVFRYAFSKPASSVRIDIFTYTGNLVYSWKEPSGAAAVNYPDWNEHIVSIARLGPGVYRCRLGAKVGGKEISRFWKLAVVK